MNVIKLFAAILAVFVVFSFNTNASSIAIDSLYVDSASVSLSVNSINLFSRSRSFPSLEITMGEYQNSIALFNAGMGGSLNIYSTGSHGAAAPSGYLDGTTVNVDLSSVRAGFSSWLVNFDVGIWPINTPQTNGVYDPDTGLYALDWRYNFLIDCPGTRCDISGFFLVQLQGHLTTMPAAVPLPAAVWLFGSGMVGLFGLTMRRKY